MSRSDPKPASAPSRSPIVPVAIGCVLLLCVFQAWWAVRIDGRIAGMAADREALQAQLRELEGVSARLERAALQASANGEEIAALDKRLGPVLSMGNDWDIVVDDVSRMDARLARLVAAFEVEFGIEVDNPKIQMPEIDWTQPELYAAAKKAAAEVGIELTEDEVRVPSRIALRDGLLEYFAVLKGGKEHEALLSLDGNAGREDRRAPELGARLNNALLALGFRRGKPIRFTSTGTRPAQGETVHVYLEWSEDGKTKIVRAEDLVWNRVTGAPMERGKWVYVGSSYVPGDAEGEMIFAADLTAEAISTYSAVNTIIDNITLGAADDTVFLVAQPRIPKDLSEVTLILRRTPRLDAFEFEGPLVMDRGAEDQPEDDAPETDDRPR